MTSEKKNPERPHKSTFVYALAFFCALSIYSDWNTARPCIPSQDTKEAPTAIAQIFITQ